MSRDGRAALAERKALLVTRVQLDRARLSLAAHEVRALLRPSGDATRRTEVRPLAATLIAVALPLLGRTRLARLVKIASYALTAVRIARNWRG